MPGAEAERCQARSSLKPDTQQLPEAGEVVPVWRADERRVPDLRAIERLAGASRRHAHGALGGGLELSVTGLLDWFRPGTSVEAVAAAVDEIVPQFYDVQVARLERSVAHQIDETAWAAALGRLHTPFRVGISVFGRAERVRETVDSTGARRVTREAFRDVGLTDLVLRAPRPPALLRSPAGEPVLQFDGSPLQGLGLLPGDLIEAVLPAPDVVRTAVAAARKLGPWCRGVVFFRWPTIDETLVATPGEVASWVAGSAPPAPEVRLEAADGGCAPLRCVDLRVTLGNRWLPQAEVGRIRASADVAWIVTHAPRLLSQGAARELRVTVPAYIGTTTVPLGRAYTRQKARYALETVNQAAVSQVAVRQASELVSTKTPRNH